jgi:hypothetical protein
MMAGGTIAGAVAFVAILLQDSGAEAKLRERWKESQRSAVARDAELAAWAFDHDLFREASQLASGVLRADPNHTIAALLERIRAIPTDALARRYRDAKRKVGNELVARAKKAHGAASAELASLAAEAEKAKLEDVAEAIYLDAFRIDPTHHGAEVFLRKRGYVLIFNYGAIPKDERDRVRKNLQTLGGDLLEEHDLKKELGYWSDAWGLSTRHYRFVSNAPHARVFAFAQAGEDLYEAWGQQMKEWGLPIREITERLPAQLYDSRASFDAILPLGGMEAPTKDRDLLGFYYPNNKTGCFYDDASIYADDLGLLAETFYHEGSHQLFDLRLRIPSLGDAGKYPLAWLDEGIATYMETLAAEEKSGKRALRVGALLDDDLQRAIDAAAEGKLWPLEKFAHLTPKEFDDFADAYPEAGALVHFLVNGNGGAYRKAFGPIVEEVRKQGGLKKNLFETLGVPAGKLDDEFTKHLRSIGASLPRREYRGR